MFIKEKDITKENCLREIRRLANKTNSTNYWRQRSYCCQRQHCYTINVKHHCVCTSQLLRNNLHVARVKMSDKIFTALLVSSKFCLRFVVAAATLVNTYFVCVGFALYSLNNLRTFFYSFFLGTLGLNGRNRLVSWNKQKLC